MTGAPRRATAPGGAGGRRDRRGGASGQGVIERMVMGVPARIMRPRLLLIAIAAALTCFGLVMIFSASSVEALAEQGDAAYYVKRQAGFIAMGVAFAIACAKVDYHKLVGDWFLPIVAVTVLVLLAVRVAGSSGGGATRWFSVAGIRLQPSEFAKISLLLVAARIANEFFGEQRYGLGTFAGRFLGFVGVPLFLILIQPDNGTTAIILLMCVFVFVEAGMPWQLVAFVLGVGAALFLVVLLVSGYASDRVAALVDPWGQQFDNAYQLTRGFMAFGSGGVFGLGLGMSRMKYSYLPEAHNDFIFAVIGEELGLVGTLAVVALFAALLWAILRVSRNASDFLGRLVAVAVAALIAAQFFLNAMGVLALFPLSGKPMPFLSYGGSSIMSCLMLVGLAVNVSLGSSLPETVHDVRRRSMTLAEEEDTGVGEPHVHAGTHDAAPLAPSAGASRAGSAASRAVPLASPEEARRGLRLVDGGSSASGALGRAERGSADGRGRIDLGPSASERLRPSSGPTVRRGRGSFPSGRGGSVGAARSGRPGTSRGASDRFSNGGARPSRPRRRG